MTFCIARRTLSNICLYGIYAASLPLIAYGQHQGHSAQTQQLAVIVDGRKTPDQISDELAWSHFLTVIAEHQNATPEEVRRRESRILQVQLSKPDALSLVNATNGLKEQLDDIDSVRARDGRSQALHERWNSVMTSARERVRSSLSADGLSRLDTFIREQVKPAIKIYGVK